MEGTIGVDEKGLFEWHTKMVGEIQLVTGWCICRPMDGNNNRRRANDGEQHLISANKAGPFQRKSARAGSFTRVSLWNIHTIAPSCNLQRPTSMDLRSALCLINFIIYFSDSIIESYFSM